MKSKALLIQILPISNVLKVFNDIDYSTKKYLREEYIENLFDTVSLLKYSY
ncbi:hypothetical protein U5U50_01935 [Mycoplasma sp. 888]|uniref:hypothetical protein n=1 Tax=Mycoplasma sp. 888 TaxID=3108483 RepID=UPI002D7A2F3E|nr:hypothetical protein [Mycoplasma sp. 888]WRQ25555.1 hypothetical protein U5U50_01935 [Mycoplasma sp. 888]